MALKHITTAVQNTRRSNDLLTIGASQLEKFISNNIFECGNNHKLK